MSKVTLKEIAEKARTSKAAVSLVLNSKQYHRVSAATRDKIERVARELNYRPNFQAQSLALGKTNNIALTLNSMTPFYQEYTRILTGLCEKAGYNVFAFETYSDPDREAKVLKMINQGMFDGCICLEYNQTNRTVYDSSQHQVPTIFRGWNMLESYPEHMLKINYSRSIERLFAHLAEQGWSKLGIITDSSPKDSKSSDPVRQGIYTEMLDKYKLRIEDNDWIMVQSDCPDYMSYVHKRCVEVLSADPDVDALIVQSASEVPAVYKAVSDCGREIGGDIAISTFDRVPILNYMVPEVTHIYEPVDLIAKMLMDEVVNIIDKDKCQDRLSSIEITTELAIMPSTIKKIK